MKDLALSFEQETQLRRELKRPSSASMYRRAAALLALHRGRSPREVAAVLGVTRQTVYNWLRYRAQDRPGLNLDDAPRAGRPSLWKGQAERILLQALERSPRELGVAAPYWTAALLQKYLHQLQCPKMSEETVRRRLRNLGYSWSAGRYTRPLESSADLASTDAAEVTQAPHVSS